MWYLILHALCALIMLGVYVADQQWNGATDFAQSERHIIIAFLLLAPLYVLSLFFNFVVLPLVEKLDDFLSWTLNV